MPHSWPQVIRELTPYHLRAVHPKFLFGKGVIGLNASKKCLSRVIVPHKHEDVVEMTLY